MRYQGRDGEERKQLLIRHSFHEKPVMSPTVFHSNGAHEWRSKVTTMSEELRRRLLHMDTKHSRKDILDVVRKFFQKMEDSKYGKPAREEVIRSAVKKYWRMVLKEVTGRKDMYRTREVMNKEGRFKNMRTQTWFKSRRGGANKSSLMDSGMVTEREELTFLEKIEEQKWKTGSEMEGKNRRNKRVDDGRKYKREKEGKVRNVETVVFVPSTDKSKLKEILQKADDQMTKILNTPAVKFVERGGTTIIEDLGRTNPWSQDWFCPRKECAPCNGRLFLAQEEKEETLARVGKEGKSKSSTSRKDKMAKPSCTAEGINYVIECVACRKEGRKRRNNRKSEWGGGQDTRYSGPDP